MTGETADANAAKSASPYSTGGGGVTFERKFGTLVLTRMLACQPVTALDARVPTRIKFQQARATAVDDLVLATETAEGTGIRLDIAVRRSPRFVTSNAKTGELVASLVAADMAAEARGESWAVYRLAVVVSGRQTHAKQLAELSDAARTQGTAAGFFELVRAPGVTRASGRLEHLVRLVSNALDNNDHAAAEAEADGLTGAESRTYRLLRRLWMWQADLEAGEEEDWTRLIDDLADVSLDGSQEQGVDLRNRLALLSGDIDIRAGDIDRQLLLQHLHGRIASSALQQSAGWRRLAALDRQVRATTGRVLSSAVAGDLRLPRITERQRLQAALETCATLLITGDSGVGKSALVMDATAPGVIGDDAQALAVNLRHLPSTPGDVLNLFDRSVEELLGEMTATRRILVIDGCEAVTDQHRDVMTQLAAAAKATGTQLVAVTTSEGAAPVNRALAAAGVTAVEHEIAGLDDEELTLIEESFPSLGRLLADHRGRELLRRPIVVELLGGTGDPGVPLTDSQALAHIWSRLVRDDERRQHGTPDARQEVMLRLAEHEIVKGDVTSLMGALDFEGLVGLRRSGMLQPASQLAWQRAPMFRHDLLRSYSVARLLLTNEDPAAALTKFGAPRWTLPCARLACEMLLSAEETGNESRVERFDRLQAGLDRVAEDTQLERWSDVPSEALLETPHADTLIADAWPYLIKDGAKGVARLIRLVNSRHRTGGIYSDAVSPLIRQLLEAGAPKGLGNQTNELLTNWLTSLAISGEPAGNRLRIRLRDAIVADCAERNRLLDEQHALRTAERAARTTDHLADHEGLHRRTPRLTPSPISPSRRRRRTVGRRPYEWIDDSHIEQLALLGADLGTAGEIILRRIAEEDPYKLQGAVEAIGGGLSLATYSADLLAHLSVAYYIDKPSDDDDEEEEFGSFGLRDDGIRDHKFSGGSLASLTSGPFLALLRRDYVLGVKVVNLMLDHAAQHRSRRRGWRYSPDDEAEPMDAGGIRMAVTGESRMFAGDGQEWLWYRSLGTGPYPCTSALQALEYVSDELIGVGIPVTRLAKVLLDGAHNLAMPALVFGLLVRHLEESGDALDGFLAEPVVWEFEFSRTVGEGRGLRLSAPVPDISHPERRSWTPFDVATHLVWSAGEDRVAQLRGVGRQLEVNGRQRVGDDTSWEAVEWLARVRQWSLALDRDAYSASPHEQGWLVQQKVDPEVRAVLAAGQQESTRRNEAAGLALRHVFLDDSAGRGPRLDDATIATDLALARELLGNAELRRLDGEAASSVAATALELRLTGEATVSDDDLIWSANLLLQVAEDIEAHDEDQYSPLFSDRLDVAAGRGLPYLLLPAALELRTSLGADGPSGVDRFLASLRNLVSYASREARLAFALSLDALWLEPCADALVPGQCHHEVALSLVTDSFVRCRLGGWSSNRREVQSLEPADATGLDAVSGENLLADRLTPALRSAGSAAVSSACCADAASATLARLLAAHRRGMLVDSYHRSDDDALVAARAALTQVLRGRSDVVLDHISALTGTARPLAEALRGIGVAGEENPELGKHLHQLWPQIMDAVLDAAEATEVFREPTWGDYAEAALIPIPSFDRSLLTLEMSGEPYRWRDLTRWAAQVKRWLSMISGSTKALDQLVIAIRELELADQVRVGLPWVEEAVERAGVNCGATWTLPEWLHDRQGDVTGEDRERWQRVVDRLAVAGDARVADLSD